MKAKHLINGCCLLLLLCILPLLAVGCNTGAGGATGTTENDTNEVETVKPNEYTAQTQTFETFKDLKANVALYKDQAPCTRSTEGYYSAGDGGAATYNITTEKPEGISEKLTGGLYAQLAPVNGYVTPQMFGAYGNGKADDSIALLRGITFARDNGLTLTLTKDTEYYTLSTMTLENVTVRSENAKISYNGKDQNRPAIDMKDNASIYGKLRVYAVDNKMSNHGGRAGIGFGYYGSGEGAHHCYIEEVEITGGIPNGNAVIITGDSSDITIDKVVVPKGTAYGRGVLLHWGTAEDHWPTKPGDFSGGYSHKENYRPTTHPHDIKLGRVECYSLDFYYDSAAVWVSAGYDVTVDEIVCDDIYMAMSSFTADIGFEYATEAEKAHGMKNIKVGKITATNLKGPGIYLCGTHQYLNMFITHVELEIGEAYLESAPNYRHYYTMGMSGGAMLKIGKLTVKSFDAPTLSFAYGIESVEIGEYNVIDCKSHPLQINTPEGQTPIARNIHIGTLNVAAGCGSGGALINVNHVDGLTIDKIKIDGGNYTSLIAIYAGCKNISIDDIEITNTNLTAIYHAKEAIPAENYIHITATEGFAPSMGESCSVTKG